MSNYIYLLLKENKDNIFYMIGELKKKSIRADWEITNLLEINRWIIQLAKP